MPTAKPKEANLIYDENESPIHGDGLGYFDQNERPLTKEEIFVDSKGNLIDKRKNPVQDSSGNPINIIGLHVPNDEILGDPLTKVFGVEGGQGDFLYDKNGKPHFGEGGYFNKKGLPVDADDILIDSQGNLLDGKKVSIYDSNNQPLSVKPDKLTE